MHLPDDARLRLLLLLLLLPRRVAEKLEIDKYIVEVAPFGGACAHSPVSCGVTLLCRARRDGAGPQQGDPGPHDGAGN